MTPATSTTKAARPAAAKPAKAARSKPAPKKAGVKKSGVSEVSAAPADLKSAKAPVKPEKREEPVSRIRVKIRAYDHRIIDQATRTIVETAERYEARVVGPVPLPTEKVKITVNRSTFVHKNAREQFEMRVHKRLVDIINASPKCLDALMSLQLPAGVDVEVKM
ncbi:MAG: 30S ribosomal protein S10 [Candidatus Magasanikbacteria bacterium]|nr:30S ribosomal protein S10 [Candidatus Magasanikbacteria bacterium]